MYRKLEQHHECVSLAVNMLSSEQKHPYRLIDIIIIMNWEAYHNIMCNVIVQLKKVISSLFIGPQTLLITLHSLVLFLHHNYVYFPELTVANNSLECEVQIVRNKEFQIAST